MTLNRKTLLAHSVGRRTPTVRAGIPNHQGKTATQIKPDCCEARQPLLSCEGKWLSCLTALRASKSDHLLRPPHDLGLAATESVARVLAARGGISARRAPLIYGVTEFDSRFGPRDSPRLIAYPWSREALYCHRSSALKQAFELKDFCRSASLRDFKADLCWNRAGPHLETASHDRPSSPGRGIKTWARPSGT